MSAIVDALPLRYMSAIVDALPLRYVSAIEHALYLQYSCAIGVNQTRAAAKKSTITIC